jgi:hypothetical protein
MCTLPSAPPGPAVSFVPDSLGWVLVLLGLLLCTRILPYILNEGRYRPPTISRRRALQIGILGLACLMCAILYMVVVTVPTADTLRAWQNHLLATLPASCADTVYSAATAESNQVGIVTFMPAFALWVTGCVLIWWTMYKRGNLRWAWSRFR